MYQKSLHPCALDEISLGIERVKAPSYLCTVTSYYTTHLINGRLNVTATFDRLKKNENSRLQKECEHRHT